MLNRMAIATVYVIIGIGVCAGAEETIKEELSARKRVIITLLWPAIVSGLVVRNLDEGIRTASNED